MPAGPIPTRPPFVLLHGGRHGGWCWKHVASALRQQGHVVYTPTLTGLGERAHLLSPAIGLDTHVQDLVSVFEFEDIQDAVLVAHSYGGMVASGAMERIADRVRRIVFFDAHLPRTGESHCDMVGPVRAAKHVAMAQEGGEGWYIPTSDASWYGVTDPQDAAWVNSHTTAQPLKTYQDPVGNTDRAWNHPGMFIECVPSTLEPHALERVRKQHADDPEFQYRVLHATHDAMVTAPEAVTKLLLEAVDIV
ncbi:alpha/beta fold hydrolase [Streptomyces lonegramiae]|uniref:Alpha/beta fold hydrolase n=1 Tax=Streptomyces lonegramiae TaxID=3075524 RepID=A0ABU2XWN3_9ACTN|nr:alpha/beta fold hydrolase [Streptomyces sp. DSM 41529]MDT0549986.1 alpha/beta fold hydrolase [Streptomyces sp. DSM 41529]